MLPNDVLPRIFYFYLNKEMDGYFEPFKKQWITLLHVCQRWRSVVFQSSGRLNLRLLCTHKTIARDIQNIWPPLPLVIRNAFRDEALSVDNIIAILEHNDRVCQIELKSLTSSQFEYVTNSAAMQKPFPKLTDLRLCGKMKSTLPVSFLDGTTPRLRSLHLSRVPFPGLPKLLLSATHLVDLQVDLTDIPHDSAGYVQPEAMTASLSALTSLELLRLEFRYPPPFVFRPLRSRFPPPPLPTPARSNLPSLTEFRFKGGSEYLEKILTWIDAPRLNELHITFFDQRIYDLPQLCQFISRRPTLRAPKIGHVTCCLEAISVRFPSQTPDRGVLSVQILYQWSGRQLSSLEQVCTPSLPPVSTLEDLYILDNPCWRLRYLDNIKVELWQDFLRPFVAVKNLYLSGVFVPHIAPALQDLDEDEITEVLPTLENLFLEGLESSEPFYAYIKEFADARQLTGHPVAVSRWDGNSKRAFIDVSG